MSSKGCNSLTGLLTQWTNKFDSLKISSRANSVYNSERPDEEQYPDFTCLIFINM